MIKKKEKYAKISSIETRLINKILVNGQNYFRSYASALSMYVRFTNPLHRYCYFENLGLISIVIYGLKATAIIKRACTNLKLIYAHILTYVMERSSMVTLQLLRLGIWSVLGLH